MREVKLKIQPALGDQHVCTIEHERDPGQRWGVDSWRWRCTCGGKGGWQSQSDSVSVFQWFRHAWRAEGLTWPRGSGPAYRWLEMERAA